MMNREINLYLDMVDNPDDYYFGPRIPGPDQDSFRAQIFHELAKLSMGTVVHYLSDFYRDAIWLKTYVTGDAFTFYFGFRDTGTSIGTDADLVKYGNSAQNVYRVDVTPTLHDSERKVTINRVS